MSGKNLRLKKLFKGKKNLVISAIDHVMFYGDQVGIEDARAAIENCITVDALILPRFMLERNWDLFGGTNSPIPIVRINWAFIYSLKRFSFSFATAIVTTVKEAVASGAEAVICSLFLEEHENQKMEAENIAIFSEVVRQKEALGIPLIGECYVVEHKDKTADEVHLKVKRISRIMAELGADSIKTFYTGNKFHQVVENTPVPIFTIGAEKLNTDLQVLQKAYDSISQGARGIIFGRNIFMAKDPIKIVKALNKVINEGVSPEEVVEEYNLE